VQKTGGGSARRQRYHPAFDCCQASLRAAPICRRQLLPEDHGVAAVAHSFQELLKTGALALAPDEGRSIVVHIIGRR